MKKLFLSLITFLSLAVYAQDNKVITDVNATVRTLNSSFTGISVSSGIDLYLTQGNEESLAVSAADEKHLARLKTEVVNGMLKIYYDNNGVTWTSGENRKLKAYVSFKTLEKLVASAGADVTLKDDIVVESLDMKFTSGSGLTGKIDAKQLTVEQNSGSTILVSGKAEKISIDISSGADFKGYDLATDYCDAKASSGGAVHITINKELTAKASSGGGIRYKGAALIRDINISSGGMVKKS